MPSTLASWSRRPCGTCLPSAPASAAQLCPTRSSPTANAFRRRRERSWSCWLESTCNELLEHCLRGETWTDDLLSRALAVEEGRAFLSIVIERLGDLLSRGCVKPIGRCSRLRWRRF